MSTWHAEAEDWALAAVQAAASVPVVFLTPTLAPAPAGMTVYVGPAAMDTAVLRAGGAVTADMTVDITVTSAGDRPADLRRMAQETDAIVDGLARAGARTVSTVPGTVNTPQAPNPVPARTITTTVAIEGMC